MDRSISIHVKISTSMFQQHHDAYLKLALDQRFSSTSVRLSIKPVVASQSNYLPAATIFLSGWQGLSYEFLITDYEYQPERRLYLAPNTALDQPLAFGGTQITVFASPRLSQSDVRTVNFHSTIDGGDLQCAVHTDPSAIRAFNHTDNSLILSKHFYIDTNIATAKADLKASQNVRTEDTWIFFSFILSGEVLGLYTYRHPYVQYLSPPFALGISHGLKLTLVNPDPARYRFACFLVQLETPRKRVRDGEGKEWEFYTLRLDVCWRDREARDPQRTWLVFTGEKVAGVVLLRGDPASLFRDLRRIERSIITDERRRRKRGKERVIHEVAFARDLRYGTDPQTFRDELFACDSFYEEEKTLEVVEPSSNGGVFGFEDVTLVRVEKRIMTLSEEATDRAGFSLRELFLTICPWIDGRRVYRMGS